LVILVRKLGRFLDVFLGSFGCGECMPNPYAISFA